MSVEIERLIAEIDRDPDLLHADRTPAVDALVRHGLAVLPHIFPLLEGEAELTRLRAQRVLEGVTRHHVEEEEEQEARALTRGAAPEWQALWRANGSYDWRAPAEARAEAVARWREWLERARK